MLVYRRFVESFPDLSTRFNSALELRLGFSDDFDVRPRHLRRGCWFRVRARYQADDGEVSATQTALRQRRRPRFALDIQLMQLLNNGCHQGIERGVRSSPWR